MLSAAREMHTTAADLDEKQGVQGFEPRRCHRKEITSENLLTIVAQQGTPIASVLGPLGCWFYGLTFEDVSNGRAADGVAEA
jgi:hypothetical protein